MKAKYLGRYEMDVIWDDYLEESVTVFVNEDDPEDYYTMDNFILTKEDPTFDAIAGETNTSAIAAKMVECESTKLWRIW